MALIRQTLRNFRGGWNVFLSENGLRRQIRSHRIISPHAQPAAPATGEALKRQLAYRARKPGPNLLNDHNMRGVTR